MACLAQWPTTPPLSPPEWVRSLADPLGISALDRTWLELLVLALPCKDAHSSGDINPPPAAQPTCQLVLERQATGQLVVWVEGLEGDRLLAWLADHASLQPTWRSLLTWLVGIVQTNDDGLASVALHTPLHVQAPAASQPPAPPSPSPLECSTAGTFHL